MRSVKTRPHRLLPQCLELLDLLDQQRSGTVHSGAMYKQRAVELTSNLIARGHLQAKKPITIQFARSIFLVAAAHATVVRLITHHTQERKSLVRGSIAPVMCWRLRLAVQNRMRMPIETAERG